VVEAHLAGVYAAGAGRPAYRPLLLFKALLLQQWYQLSDPGLEEALVDRLSFRRLVGLGLTQRVPDHRTLSRWRARDGRVTGWVNGCWLRSTASSRRNG
jgi:transposase, IS5 family